MAEKRIILVTGANTGLGYEIVRSLLASTQQRYHVILSGRTPSKVDAAVAELAALPTPSDSTVSGLVLDIASDESIASAAAQVEAAHGRLDVLVNNAGDGTLDGAAARGEVSAREAMNRAYDVNVASTHAVTHALAPLLLRSRASADPRLLFVTSGLSSLTEEHDRTSPAEARMPKAPAGWPKPEPGARAAYRASKAALNMLFLVWRRLLEADGVKCFDVSPGILATGLIGLSKEQMLKMGAEDPKVGGDFVRDIIEGKRDQDEGYAIRRDMRQPW